jgi:hypothetical protein
MRDRLRIVVTALMTCNAAFAQNRPSNSVLDPAFATIPFDRWLTEHDQAHFRWSAQISGGQLANSQRLSARVDVQVDGNELVKRRGIGELAFFVQFSDSDRRLFQSHGAIELQKVTDAAGQSNVIFTQTALVVPGDYRVDLAILDTRTGEHATMQRTLRIASLKSDPLPDSWRGLPLVEFTEPADPPEAWFQPYLTGRLHLPLETRRPVRVEVLVNASPSAMDQRFRTSPANNRNLADLLPGLKVISQVELHQGMLNVSMLDLTRRQVLFRQDHLNPQNHPLDWPRLRPALLQADPNKIDVRDLAHRQQNGQFFVEEVRRRLAAKEVLQADSSEKPYAGEPELALIVLSGPMDFASGEDLRPIEFAQRPPGRVFYIRYHSVPIRPPTALPPPRPNRRRGFPPPQSGMVVQEPPDALEPLLKPLQPRVFDVYNPEQFRKALANLMKEIALM